jgi:hypothetical protein
MVGLPTSIIGMVRRIQLVKVRRRSIFRRRKSDRELDHRPPVEQPRTEDSERSRSVIEDNVDGTGYSSALGTVSAGAARAWPFLVKWRPMAIDPTMPRAMATTGRSWL